MGQPRRQDHEEVSLPRPARPPRRRSAAALAALAAAALLLLALGPLRGALGVRRSLQAIVVTPAPSPAAAPAGPRLALPTVGPARPGQARPVTVLILGADRRPGEEATPRSDAIIVARVDPGRGRVAILSLPRDLWAPIPGHGSNRLNSAYLWGERDGPPGGGMALARAAVGDLLGIPIDYVAAADFRGFAGLVDAIGGVTVDVQRPLEDRQFPTASHGVTTVRFAPGPQRMDGVTALTYARLRHPDSDFERGLRQQAVLLAVAERLRERGDLANLLAAERAAAALAGYVQTDMPPETIVALAWALRSLDAAAVERYALTPDDVRFGVGQDRFAQQARPGVVEAYSRLLLYGR
jgi:LCP family protein required for cell wall assembly